VGNAQRLGVPMGCGGPHPGFMAFSSTLRRHVPGRLVGVSKDTHGRAGFRLSAQTREQHIRREKATSNICTAQALPAMLVAAYVVYRGPDRLKAVAKRVWRLALALAAGLRKMGRAPLHDNFFDTLRVSATDAVAVVDKALQNGICLLHRDGVVGISIDECTTPTHIEAVWHAFGGNAPDFDAIASEIDDTLPAKFVRTDAFCTHETFNIYHTEHEMLRYLRRLGQKDIALDRSMIPLGSCTMKLNAAVQMEPLSWPLLANVHPFAPASHQAGYAQLAAKLESLLAKISGFDSVSLQPNAGAQGEYAGLLAIRRYLDSLDQGHRDVCLIPLSAHGTNPASAVMAGMRVVPVEIDNAGQVSEDDLRQKIALHRNNLAALMLTYPSTYGVFGRRMPALCELVHEAGGQVYMDGANFNALVGVSLPGQFGADVMHINLHKTFCIPHGGGGPGMGPIGVQAHLREFLPKHPMQNGGEDDYDTVSAAPWGSALILHISWMYIRMMGADGLRRATLSALLAANYIAKQLGSAYPVEFHDENGYVAHECIVDARVFKSAGVSVEDIAKRLMDYGFHAPTVSWPVAGAMMIEPTESETKNEIDRLCDALLSIVGEIKRITDGEWPRDDNPLINAPHTAEDLLVEIDNAGQVSEDDLRQKIALHRNNLAALMLTYPSTYGVFGRRMPALCELVHEAGGQVYMDGANFNALVGVSLPGQFGADVMHINLHKTFCIPHGGGGPGMGPIGVQAHLREFLPKHPMQNGGEDDYDTVSAAPWGSALILHISWMYIRMMGADGLRRATLSALLAANYIAKQLGSAYPVEFHDENGYVAHECIVDARVFKSAGVSVEDIAKRLMDYGFHAPTVSWPVAGAMMIEPTESETKNEIDRLCDALLSIVGEIKRITDGEWPRDDNPLINAPHTAEDLLVENWTHPYSRETAAYPLSWVRRHKYWPPIGRIDAAWGDRNLVCACPPIESYS
jgi:glycine cleavage system protein P-like pyridoxal-binding family